MNMAKEDEIERTATGITGFDKLIEGGLEKNSVVLVKGGTGSGKTVFSLQFVYNGCTKYDEPGVFISFAESKKSIYTTAKRFGWDMEKLEKDGTFAFIKQSPHEVERILKEGGGTIKDTVDSVGAKRIAIDSLTAYSMMFRTNYEISEGVLELMEMLKSWNCTAVVTDEETIDIHQMQGGRLVFLSDGLIHMYYIRKEYGKFRAMEIIKMRHTAHSDRISLFTIAKQGMAVSSEAGIFATERASDDVYQVAHRSDEQLVKEIKNRNK